MSRLSFIRGVFFVQCECYWIDYRKRFAVLAIGAGGQAGKVQDLLIFIDGPEVRVTAAIERGKHAEDDLGPGGLEGEFGIYDAAISHSSKGSECKAGMIVSGGSFDFAPDFGEGFFDFFRQQVRDDDHEEKRV